MIERAQDAHPGIVAARDRKAVRLGPGGEHAAAIAELRPPASAHLPRDRVERDRAAADQRDLPLREPILRSRAASSSSLISPRRSSLVSGGLL